MNNKKKITRIYFNIAIFIKTNLKIKKSFLSSFGISSFMTKQEKRKILLPKATALWLIDNTSLTFKQIADFCDLTEIEVKMMADGMLANTICPVSPIESGDLTQEEIYKREQDGKELQNTFSLGIDLNIKTFKKKKFVSLLQKQNRPDAILWLITKFPELSDQQIVKLVRTTKQMVQAIREKTHKNYDSLLLKDPVLLGFCSQTDLNNEVKKAQVKLQAQNEKEEKRVKEEQKKMIKKINVNKVKVVKANAKKVKEKVAKNKDNANKKQSNNKQNGNWKKDNKKSK